MKHNTLINHLKSKTSLVSIIGLGYVGLPLSLQFAESGYKTLGVDIDHQKVATLKKGESYIQHISSQRISACINKNLDATADFSRLTEVDAIILCVPTPLNKYREPDLSFIVETLKNILPFLRTGQIISLESTTYPGTTEEVIKPLVESTGLVVGKDIFVVYSPEREDPNNAAFTTATIPKVIGGLTAECLACGLALYEKVIQQLVPVSDAKTAEMTKLLENIYRAVNIGLVNELKIVADKMGIDIYEVIHAAATKPFGFTAYYPGPGIGGHCIPIDPFYLTWKAREYGVHTRFIELAGEINSSMPMWVVDKITAALNQRSKAVKNSRILILGVAYKKNVDDVRESPSITVMEILREKGALLDYSDPHVPVFPKMREHHFELTSVPVTKDNLVRYDCVVLLTAHAAFDYELIKQHAALLIDTRGKYAAVDNKVVKA